MSTANTIEGQETAKGHNGKGIIVSQSEPHRSPKRLKQVRQEGDKLIIEPSKASTSTIRVVPEIHDSVARLTIFRWITAIVMIFLAAYVGLQIHGSAVGAERVYNLLEKTVLMLAAVSAYYLGAGRRRT